MLVAHRHFSFDPLGRLTSETNPESGTTNYTFDRASACSSTGNDVGSMVERSGAMATADVTCYLRDALGRVTSITYPSGQYASVTPAKMFVYDSATVNGAAMADHEHRPGTAGRVGICGGPEANSASGAPPL